MWCWELLDPPSGCHSGCPMLPAQEELAGSSAHLAAIRRARQSTWHLCFCFRTRYTASVLLDHVFFTFHSMTTMTASCVQRVIAYLHMVLPPETTEFAACLCRAHSATPIFAQCVIACVNTWPSHKQTLKWLHVAAISRSYLSLHVFLFLPPAPLSECGHSIFVNCQ